MLDHTTIANEQNQDAELEHLVQLCPNVFIHQMLVHDLFVRCYIPETNAPWKIYLPNQLLEPVIQWYHLALSHVGASRLYDTMSLHFYNAKLKNKIDHFISTCDSCQWYKAIG